MRNAHIATQRLRYRRKEEKPSPAPTPMPVRYRPKPAYQDLKSARVGSERSDSKPRTPSSKKRSQTQERRSPLGGNRRLVLSVGGSKTTANLHSAHKQKEEGLGSGVLTKSVTLRRGKDIIEEQQRSVALIEGMRQSNERGKFLAAQTIKYRYGKRGSGDGSKSQVHKDSKKVFRVKPRKVEGYAKFVGGEKGQEYSVGFDFSYLRKLSRVEAEVTVDFRHFRVLESILLCCLDVLGGSLDESSSLNLLRQYALLYYRLFEKNVMEIVLISHHFPMATIAATFLFAYTRVYFAVLHELASHSSTTTYQAQLHQILTLIVEGTQALYHNQPKNPPKTNVNEAFRILKVTTNLDKIVSALIGQIRGLVKSAEQIGRISSITAEYGAFDRGGDFHGLELEYLSQVQVSVGWKYFHVPPIPYLPAKAPHRDYSLVLTLQDLLISISNHGKVTYRPFLFQFLGRVGLFFELIIFTGLAKQQADSYIEGIQRQGAFFAYRLYKEHLSFRDVAMKRDLTRLGRETERVILVVEQGAEQSGEKGVIPVRPFREEINDRQLMRLGDQLEGVARSQPEDISIAVSSSQWASLEHIEEVMEENATISQAD